MHSTAQPSHEPVTPRNDARARSVPQDFIPPELLSNAAVRRISATYMVVAVAPNAAFPRGVELHIWHRGGDGDAAHTQRFQIERRIPDVTQLAPSPRESMQPPEARARALEPTQHGATDDTTEIRRPAYLADEEPTPVAREFDLEVYAPSVVYGQPLFSEPPPYSYSSQPLSIDPLTSRPPTEPHSKPALPPTRPSPRPRATPPWMRAHTELPYDGASPFTQPTPRKPPAFYR